MTEQVPPLGCITALQVNSEAGRLRQAILHHPGKEIELMTPSNHDALLFEDILFLEQACEEHNRFKEVLKKLGVQVLLLEDLLAQALPVDPGDEIARIFGRARWPAGDVHVDRAGGGVHVIVHHGPLRLVTEGAQHAPTALRERNRSARVGGGAVGI